MTSNDARARRLAAVRRVIEEHLELAAETGSSVGSAELARAIIDELDRRYQ